MMHWLLPCSHRRWTSTVDSAEYERLVHTTPSAEDLHNMFPPSFRTDRWFLVLTRLLLHALTDPFAFTGGDPRHQSSFFLCKCSDLVPARCAVSGTHKGGLLVAAAVFAIMAHATGAGNGVQR